MRKRLTRPEFHANIQSFRNTLGDFSLIDMKCVELMGHKPLGNAHIDPPAGKLIDQRIIFRHLERIAQLHQGHRRRETDI